MPLQALDKYSPGFPTIGMPKHQAPNARDAERRRIARYLADHGPTTGDDLAEKLGLASAQFWPLINCAWFGIVTGGWTLTERGRTEGIPSAGNSPVGIKRGSQAKAGSGRPVRRSQR
jgi:hypothetical protein